VWARVLLAEYAGGVGLPFGARSPSFDSNGRGGTSGLYHKEAVTCAIELYFWGPQGNVGGNERGGEDFGGVVNVFLIQCEAILLELQGGEEVGSRGGRHVHYEDLPEGVQADVRFGEQL